MRNTDKVVKMPCLLRWQTASENMCFLLQWKHTEKRKIENWKKSRNNQNQVTGYKRHSIVKQAYYIGNFISSFCPCYFVQNIYKELTKK